MKDLPLKLKQELGVSANIAKQITEDLEKMLLVFINPVEEKELKVEEAISSQPKQQTNIPEKPKTSSKDTYREPVE